MAEKKPYVPPYIEIEPGEEDNGGSNRYRLPYGIAKGLGLNTDGMTPRQVWEMLKGKGISPEKAYEDLEKQAKTEIEKEQPQEVNAQKELDLRNIKNTVVRDALRKQNVENNAVKKLDKKLSNQEIVQKIAGGDKTKGSCVSVALAYVGNSVGYDVLDFRGGESWDVFSSGLIVREIASFEGVESIINREYNAVSNAVNMLKTMQPNKEYILVAGKHASVVRKSDNGYEYLEMQSPYENGFKPLNTDILRYRFGCQKSYSLYGRKVEKMGILIDCESLGKSNDFKNMLGYINTNEQKKGESGSVK